MAYAGKPESTDGPAANCYLTGTDEYTKYLVNVFSAYKSIQGCNISMDRYFTLISLAPWALENKFIIVETMPHDRKGISKEVKALNDREEKSILHVYYEEKKIILVSYIDKRKSGKKNVIILSTMHENMTVTKDQRKKRQVHPMYENKKMSSSCCRFVVNKSFYKDKNERWLLKVIAFKLDTCRSNTKTIFVDKGIQFTNFEFTCNIGKALILLQLNDDTATQMDYKFKLSTRCDVFLVSRRFHGSLMSRMPKQSLVGVPNVSKELLVPATQDRVITDEQ